MSDNTEATESAVPLTEAQIDVFLEVIDDILPDVCDSLSAADSPYRLVLVTAYLMTAVFATHPELYGEFIRLLAAFQPRYEALAQQFAASFPEAWAEREEDQVIVLQPSIAKYLPTIATN